MKHSITIGLCILLLVSCSASGEDISVTQQELAIAEKHSLSVIPALQQIYEKGCWLDDDCDDSIWCTGVEWCCSPRGQHWWNGCEPGKCYQDPSPCGTPISAILAICDLEWDTCRGCYTDEECNVDTKYSHVAWGWCGGPRRCGGADEEHHHGVCLGAGPFPCEWYEICNEEEELCEPRPDPPECRYDSDCSGLEAWCDINGKCQNN